MSEEKPFPTNGLVRGKWMQRKIMRRKHSVDRCGQITDRVGKRTVQVEDNGANG